MSSPPMRPPTGESTLAYAAEWARGKMNDRKPIDCPLCRRKIQVARRRASKGWAQTLIGIAIVTKARRTQRVPYPWIHVEDDVLRAGISPSKGHDWANMQFLGVIERATKERDPKVAGVGLWRLTPLGARMIREPKAALVPEWVDTWNGRAWKQSTTLVSLQRMLGREFDFREEIKRAPKAAA